MNIPTQLRKTTVEGCTVSTIRNTFPQGSYTETRIFTNGVEIEGLEDMEEMDMDRDWQVNHDLAIQKVVEVFHRHI